MRVLIDYRSALRGRSGAGEYAHQLIRALLVASPARGENRPIDLSLFSSSWRDRLHLPPEISGATPIDRRVPVALLNFAWHRLEWPPVEWLARGSFDIAHSMHPLLMPTRKAARVVTIHDLNFLTHPERTRAEVRRDYPRLAGDHAHRADGIVVSSRFTAGEVERRLQVPSDRISICSPGAPDWTPRSSQPRDGYILFLGTLELRKNLGTLLDAYERLIAGQGRVDRSARAARRGGSTCATVPDLVLAGQATPESQPWLDRLSRAPLAGRARHLGYVDPANLKRVYEGARLLVQPSFEEGFGIPVLEAMTLGVPVVAANRGALPEVLGDAGLLVEPEDADGMAAAIGRIIDEDGLAESCAVKGVVQSRRYQWSATAIQVLEAYRLAVARQKEGSDRGLTPV